MGTLTGGLGQTVLQQAMGVCSEEKNIESGDTVREAVAPLLAKAGQNGMVPMIDVERISESHKLCKISLTLQKDFCATTITKVCEDLISSVLKSGHNLATIVVDMQIPVEIEYYEGGHEKIIKQLSEFASCSSISKVAINVPFVNWESRPRVRDIEVHPREEMKWPNTQTETTTYGACAQEESPCEYDVPYKEE